MSTRTVYLGDVLGYDVEFENLFDRVHPWEEKVRKRFVWAQCFEGKMFKASVHPQVCDAHDGIIITQAPTPLTPIPKLQQR